MKKFFSLLLILAMLMTPQITLRASGDYSVSPVSGTGVVEASSALNMRSGPGQDYDKLLSLKSGDSLTITGQTDNGWYEVEYEGKSGFVSSRYVKAELSTDVLEGEDSRQDTEAGEPEEGYRGVNMSPKSIRIVVAVVAIVIILIIMIITLRRIFSEGDDEEDDAGDETGASAGDGYYTDTSDRERGEDYYGDEGAYSEEEDLREEGIDDEEAFDDGEPYDDEGPFDDEEDFDDEEPFEDEEDFDDEEPFEDEEDYDDEEPFEDEEDFDDDESFEDDYDGDEPVEDRGDYDCGDGYGDDHPHREKARRKSSLREPVIISEADLRVDIDPELFEDKEPIEQPAMVTGYLERQRLAKEADRETRLDEAMKKLDRLQEEIQKIKNE